MHKVGGTFRMPISPDRLICERTLLHQPDGPCSNVRTYAYGNVNVNGGSLAGWPVITRQPSRPRRNSCASARQRRAGFVRSVVCAGAFEVVRLACSKFVCGQFVTSGTSSLDRARRFMEASANELESEDSASFVGLSSRADLKEGAADVWPDPPRYATTLFVGVVTARSSEYPLRRPVLGECRH